MIRLNRYRKSFQITQEDFQAFFAALAAQEAAIREEMERLSQKDRPVYTLPNVPWDPP